METRDTRPRCVVVLGDVMTDIVARVHAPIAVGSDTPAAISLHGGGSGANQAAWLAATDSSLEVHFVGCVGDDALGAAQRATLTALGLRTHLTVDPARPTGSVVALVDAAGERSMLTDRGANAGLSADHLPTELFREDAWLHVSGYMLLAEETRDAALAALRLAREARMGISVDPVSTALLVGAGPRRFLEWTRGADLCFPNLEEALLLAEADAPETAARALGSVYGGVALKLGAEGALWARAGEPPVRVPCLPAAMVDSTGAGDAFCAGFLAAWLRGSSPLAALAAAVACGASAVAQPGARPPGSGYLRQAQQDGS
jgi:sugar/nucleoside kinase (ribokinase family)